MTTSSYLTYNALGILFWVAVYAGIGYGFASTLEVIFGRIKHFELVIALVIITIGVIFFAGHYLAERILARFSKN